jgi:hypothetical protein
MAYFQDVVVPVPRVQPPMVITIDGDNWHSRMSSSTGTVLCRNSSKTASGCFGLVCEGTLSQAKINHDRFLDVELF